MLAETMKIQILGWFYSMAATLFASTCCRAMRISLEHSSEREGMQMKPEGKQAGASDILH